MEQHPHPEQTGWDTQTRHKTIPTSMENGDNETVDTYTMIPGVLSESKVVMVPYLFDTDIFMCLIFPFYIFLLIE